MGIGRLLSRTSPHRSDSCNGYDTHLCCSDDRRNGHLPSASFDSIMQVVGGRWGVVPASEHQEILVAIASLIRAQRYEMALTILDNELSGGS